MISCFCLLGPGFIPLNYSFHYPNQFKSVFLSSLSKISTFYQSVSCIWNILQVDQVSYHYFTFFQFFIFFMFLVNIFSYLYNHLWSSWVDCFPIFTCGDSWWDSLVDPCNDEKIWLHMHVPLLSSTEQKKKAAIICFWILVLLIFRSSYHDCFSFSVRCFSMIRSEFLMMSFKILFVCLYVQDLF